MSRGAMKARLDRIEAKLRLAQETQLEAESTNGGAQSERAPDICDKCGDDFPADLLRVFRVNSGPLRRKRLCPECLEEAVGARLRKPVKCRSCSEVKDASNFLIERRKGGHPHRMTMCNDCRRWKYREKNYGISRQEFELHLEQQGGKCAICRSPDGGGKGDGWHVDHSHKTGEVRGILCSACNTGLGMLGDKPEVLIAASVYVSVGNYLGPAALWHNEGVEAHPAFHSTDNA